MDNYQYTGKANDGVEYTVNLEEKKALLVDNNYYEFHDRKRNITILDGTEFGLDVRLNEEPATIINGIHFILNNAAVDLYKYNILIVKGILKDGKLTGEDEKIVNDAIITQANFAKIYDYYYEKLNRKSYDDLGSEITVLINIQNNIILGNGDWLNALWAGTDDNDWFEYDKFFIGGNNGVTFGRGLDCLAHEYTHAVSGSIVNFNNDGESGSLNEAYSDIIAMAIDSKDYTMGEDFGSIVRDISNPNKYKNPTSKGGKYHYPTDTSIYTEEWLKSKGYTKYEDYDKNGSHTNMTIPTYAAYLMYKNGAFKDKDEMAKVWYHSLFYLTSDADFEDCALAVIKSAEELNLSEKSLVIIEQAFADTKMLERKYFDLSGKVEDNKKKPLKSAEVVVTNALNEHVSYRIYTKKKGTYKFKNIPKGIYKVKYSKIDYSTVEKEITLKENLKKQNAFGIFYK